jgi:hypothetical protein
MGGFEPVMESGWFHVDKAGMLEDFTQPCQASIHRFDMEWPDDCTSINHALFGAMSDEPGGRHKPPTPSDTAIYELKGNK